MGGRAGASVVAQGEQRKFMEPETCEEASVGMVGMRVGASGESREAAGGEAASTRGSAGGESKGRHRMEKEGAPRPAGGEGMEGAGGLRRGGGTLTWFSEDGENVDGWWAMTWMARGQRMVPKTKFCMIGAPLI
jgi:hypothetical protein